MTTWLEAQKQQVPKTWPRVAVPKMLPWMSYRQIDHWARSGLWEPADPPNGIGSRAFVTAADLEGLGVLARITPYLHDAGGHQKDKIRRPAWVQIREACEVGGLWLASFTEPWQRWIPDIGQPPAVAVLVDVGAIVAVVHQRIMAWER